MDSHPTLEDIRMNTPRSLLQQIVRLGAILLMGMSVSACSDSWKEEVLLHDGSKLIVERSVERGGQHEIGQKPSFKWQRLIFTMPVSDEKVTWEDNYSEDIGHSNFLPMLLDVKQGVAYLVANPLGCLSYNKWGRPNPPYVVFKYEGKEWKRITLQELPAEMTTPNLIISSPDEEAKKIGKSPVPAEVIQKIISEYRQPENKTILREPLLPMRTKELNQWCGEMVYDGKGGWVGIGWFKNKQTKEACTKYCEQEKIIAQYCPCATLFKGK